MLGKIGILTALEKTYYVSRNSIFMGFLNHLQTAIKLRTSIHKNPNVLDVGIDIERLKQGSRQVWTTYRKSYLRIEEKTWGPSYFNESRKYGTSRYRAWSTGIICHIIKEGSMYECSYKRGITILLVAYKIMTNILLNRIYPYYETII